MSINKFQEHLFIIPEDTPYKSLANGFVNHDAVIDKRIQIKKLARGWWKLIDIFLDDFTKELQQYGKRHILLLLDLDGDHTRQAAVLNKMPAAIKDRVFVLSCLNEAEYLKREMACGGIHMENIGMKLAESCYNNTYADPDNPWLCTQLQHNKNELTRLAETVRPFLFS